MWLYVVLRPIEAFPSSDDEPEPPAAPLTSGLMGFKLLTFSNISAATCNGGESAPLYSWQLRSRGIHRGEQMTNPSSQYEQSVASANGGDVTPPRRGLPLIIAGVVGLILLPVGALLGGLAMYLGLLFGIIGAALLVFGIVQFASKGIDAMTTAHSVSGDVFPQF